MARNLQIESLPAEQDNSWVDRDTILLHAAFQVLVDFVEKEKPYEVALFPSCAWHDKPIPDEEKQYVTAEESEKQMGEWKRLFALYRWWKDVRLLRESGAGPLERRVYDEDSERLCELARLREHLWT